MAIADRHGLPVAVGIASASPHETKLVEATLRQRFTRKRPQRMIGDLAYDSDPLDQRLRRRGVRLIAPHKGNRVRPKTQDGRELRRYCRRWKIERLSAWLHNFRRFLSRLTVLGAEPELGEQRVKYKTRSKCAQEIGVAQVV
jgi:transposase